MFQLLKNPAETKKYLDSVKSSTGALVSSRHNKSIKNRNSFALEIEAIREKYHLSMKVVLHIIDNDIQEFDTNCVICGKPIDFEANPHVIKQTCCYECAKELGKRKMRETNLTKYGSTCSLANPKVRQKAIDTNIHKYGVVNVFQAKEIKDRIRQTNLKRYGTEVASQSDVIKDRIRGTCAERYGTEYFFQSDEFKKKSTETCMEHYGVEHNVQADEVKAKIKQSILDRYGVEHISQADEVKAKVRQTTIDHYGVTCSLAAPEIREKVVQTWTEKYGADHPTRSEEVKEKNRVKHRALRYHILEKVLQDRNVEMITTYEEHLKSDTIRFRCLTCGEEFETKWSAGPQSRIWCPTCHKSHSFGEEQLYQFLAEIIGEENILRNQRKIIPPYELDVYIPSKNLAIEYDGIFWHSTNLGEKDPEYHSMKTEMCYKKKITLIHIFENEWLSKPNIVKSIIRHRLGLHSERIFARKCKVVKLSDYDYRLFLECNHIQGYATAKIRLGLEYNNELVACIGIGPSRFKQGETELIRFCTKTDTGVVGALSKLMKHSEVEHLITYLDRRYFTGKGYAAANFRVLGVTRPNYRYVKGDEVLSRYSCMKSNLPNILGDKFDPALTEVENMTLAGYFQLYDCGMLKYEYPAR